MSQEPQPPQLTFFCELGASELEQLFADTQVMQHMLALKASISLG